MENYSLADIRSAVGDNAFGSGGSSTMLIILFLLIFGGKGFGLGGGDYGQYATAASQQEILFGQHFQNLDNKMDRLGNGVADATFALNNTVTNEGRNIQMQLAECCCNNQKNVDALRYDMATQFAASNANTTAQVQKVLDAMAQNKIDALQAEVSDLKTANMFCGVPRISPYMYNVQPNCGCGCGNI